MIFFTLKIEGFLSLLFLYPSLRVFKSKTAKREETCLMLHKLVHQPTDAQKSAMFLRFSVSRSDELSLRMMGRCGGWGVRIALQLASSVFLKPKLIS